MNKSEKILSEVLKDESARRELVEKMISPEGAKEGSVTFTISTRDGRTVVVSVPPGDHTRPRI